MISSWCEEDWVDRQIAYDFRRTDRERREAEERLGMREILRDELRRSRGQLRRRYK